MVTSLKGRKATFVQHYLRVGNGAEAARLAGYSPRCARERASTLLNRDPAVKAAVEAGRQAMEDRNKFTIDHMVQQLDSDRAFAIETKNATAAVRASELKAKLFGMMVDRHDVRTVGSFAIVIEGIG